MKMRINGENDIDVVRVEKDIYDSDSEEGAFSDELDSEPDLVATCEGRMRLELKRNRFCVRCKKPLKTVEVRQRFGWPIWLSLHVFGDYLAVPPCISVFFP